MKCALNRWKIDPHHLLTTVNCGAAVVLFSARRIIGIVRTRMFIVQYPGTVVTLSCHCCSVSVVCPDRTAWDESFWQIPVQPFYPLILSGPYGSQEVHDLRCHLPSYRPPLPRWVQNLICSTALRSTVSSIVFVGVKGVLIHLPPAACK
jgi:hypothetical protein